MASDPAWKRAFDGLDRTVGASVNRFARSEDFATVTALARRGQGELQRRSERLSRRALHVLNLPAASDVNRLLTQITHLEREVRELRKELTDSRSHRKREEVWDRASDR